tara:strand:- start:448 stop:1101 length:654 start_codon:yes stop_codon:yes gene_type:complete
LKDDLKKLFLKSLESNNEYSEAHLQLALIYEKEKDFINAEKHLELAISFYQNNINSLQNKGDLLLKKSQFQNAKIEFSKAQDKRTLCADVFYQQAKYFLRQKKIEDAQNSFKNSIKMNDLNYKSHCDLGIIFLDKGHLDNARLHMEKAVSLNYGDSESHYYLASIMLKMKDFKEAEQHFLSALDILITINQLEAIRLYEKIKIDFPKLSHSDLEKIM